MKSFVRLPIPAAFIFLSLGHPREKFAQTFAAGFLMPASKVRAIIEKEFGGRKLNLEQALYLKRYFGVSFAAMLRKVREMGFLSAAQFEELFKRDPESREKEVFGRSIFSDRYKLLQLEAAKKKRRSVPKAHNKNKNPRGGVDNGSPSR